MFSCHCVELVSGQQGRRSQQSETGSRHYEVMVLFHLTDRTVAFVDLGLLRGVCLETDRFTMTTPKDLYKFLFFFLIFILH